MKNIIKNTINSCFVVWLKIFEPIKSKKEVLCPERYDVKNKKTKNIDKTKKTR